MTIYCQSCAAKGEQLRKDMEPVMRAWFAAMARKGVKFRPLGIKDGRVPDGRCHECGKEIA